VYLSSLELFSFQSHEHSTIDFDPYFNCIVGKSRAGKSSIVRALGFLLYDIWDDAYIRHGAAYASVKATLSTGHKVERQKGPDINKIIVTDPDGKVRIFEKFGIHSPPEVKAILQVFPVTIEEGYEINLNLSDQDDPSFLLSETAPMKTKYLNRLTGAHILDTALRSLNKDKLAASADKQRCEASITELDYKLSRFSDLCRRRHGRRTKSACLGDTSCTQAREV